MNANIYGAVEQGRAAMVEFARELIVIPSENPPGKHYGDVVEALSRQLKQLGFESQVHGDCLLSFLGDGDGRVLYFSGHYDVVPAQDATQFNAVLREQICSGGARQT